MIDKQGLKDVGRDLAELGKALFGYGLILLSRNWWVFLILWQVRNAPGAFTRTDMLLLLVVILLHADSKYCWPETGKITVTLK